MDRFVMFTGEENKKEFLIKCIAQWNLTANSDRPDMVKIMELGSLFSEMRHRIGDLD